MKKKNWIVLVLVAFFAGLFGSLSTRIFSKMDPVNDYSSKLDNEQLNNQFRKVNFNAANAVGSVDFIEASKNSTPTVVFIKTVSQSAANTNPFSWFFDPYGSQGRAISSTGSGVIISKDGYIVTNNHVVQGADKLTVILNQKKKEFTAKLIGTDPSTDLALLKIDAQDLPFVAFANSDNVQIGEWVLAVGNPFNLTSTVTAGIVSAKGRNINIVDNQFPIESFIQTDAAINPGNSGGALVNLEGKLIGINTAIASNTGSYNGYGFAIPSNIVNKIVKDFIEFGRVQRGFTGLTIEDIDFKLQEKQNINLDYGVYVNDVIEESTADKAGIRVGDIIIALGDKSIGSKSSYDEHLSYYRPNDEITLTIVRKGETKKVKVKLVSEQSTIELLRKNTIYSTDLAADFTPLTAAEKEKYKISGVKVTGINRGPIAQMGISEGFIITKYNGVAYDNAAKLIEAMKNRKGRIEVEGVGPDGGKRFLSFYGY